VTKNRDALYQVENPPTTPLGSLLDNRLVPGVQQAVYDAVRLAAGIPVGALSGITGLASTLAGKNPERVMQGVNNFFIPPRSYAPSPVDMLGGVFHKAGMYLGDKTLEGLGTSPLAVQAATVASVLPYIGAAMFGGDVMPSKLVEYPAPTTSVGYKQLPFRNPKYPASENVTAESIKPASLKQKIPDYKDPDFNTLNEARMSPSDITIHELSQYGKNVWERFKKFHRDNFGAIGDIDRMRAEIDDLTGQINDQLNDTMTAQMHLGSIDESSPFYPRLKNIVEQKTAEYHALEAKRAALATQLHDLVQRREKIKVVPDRTPISGPQSDLTQPSTENTPTKSNLHIVRDVTKEPK